MEDQQFIQVLYASQTGTAENEALLLALQLRERGATVQLSSMDDYNIVELPECKYCIFMVSTTGQGEAPDNMMSFWSFLLIKTLPKDALSSLKFSIFGFGDSAYEKYNSMARKVYQRLLQLGASELAPRGLGDDRKDGGYLVDLYPWKKSLFQKIESKILGFEALDERVEGLRSKPDLRFDVSIQKSGNSQKKTTPEPQNNQNQNPIISLLSSIDSKRKRCSKILRGKLTNRTRMTSGDHFQDVQLLEVGYSTNTTIVEGQNSQVSEQVEYSPGDVAVIFPKNSKILIKKAIDYFKLEEGDIISFDPSLSGAAEQPYSINAVQLFGQLLKLSETPSFFFFKLLQYYCGEELYKERIQEMNYDEYYQYAIRERRDLFEILFDFKGIQLPLAILVNYLGFQRPRLYSISSSPLKKSNSFELTVGILEYESYHGSKTAQPIFLNQIQGQVTGVCSQFFQDSALGSEILFRIEKGTMNFPSSEINTPIFMIGPGTGIAPFISFLEHRGILSEAQQHQEGGQGQGMTRHLNYLYTGNRYKEKDFLFGKFLKNLQKEQKLSLESAFSRDQDSKDYVQHRIKNNSFRLSLFLRENIDKILIYVAGTSKYMPKSVKLALLEVLGVALKDKSLAEEKYAEMERRKQIVFETWQSLFIEYLFLPLQA